MIIYIWAGFSPYGLSVYDFSNQTEPISVGPFQNRFEGYGLAASGDYLYLVDLTNGFWIFNISTRTNPVQVYRSTFLPAPTPSEVRVFGNYAFLGCNGGSLPGGSDGALIYDVSDPTNVSFMSSVYMPLPQSWLKALAVSGSYVYLAYFYGSQVSIFSLGIPSSTLGITPVTGDNIILSWPTPTTALAVQQSFNVSPPNWITLTNLPVVVGTNNQVTISRPPRTMFYRLVAR